MCDIATLRRVRENGTSRSVTTGRRLAAAAPLLVPDMRGGNGAQALLPLAYVVGRALGFLYWSFAMRTLNMIARLLRNGMKLYAP
jgi:hypothetical protein